jgi:hypothetical protein
MKRNKILILRKNSNERRFLGDNRGKVDGWIPGVPLKGTRTRNRGRDQRKS